MTPNEDPLAPPTEQLTFPLPERKQGLPYWRRHPWVVTFEAAVLLLVLGGGVRRWSTPVIALTVDGKSQTLRPKHAKTVAEVLKQQKITLGKEDLVQPSLTDPIHRNMAIKIIRVTHKTEEHAETLPLKITEQTRLKSNLRSVLVQKGYTKTVTRKIRKTFHDTLEVDSKEIRSKAHKQALYTLTLFNAKGFPEKTYDLTKAKVLHLRSTGYYVGEKTVPSDTTYLGYKLQRGLVAVDPRVIPLKTRLYVKGYGYAYAADTGGKIKGMRIDLAVKDKYEEARMNRYNVPVYILEKANHW